MRFIFLIATTFIITVHVSLSQTGWIQQNSNCSATLAAVAFLNADSGFCVGGYGKILKTTNGGSNWDSVDTPFTTHLLSVVVLNSNEVLACGFNRTVLKSIDFGNNWYRITNIYDGYSLNNLEFANENVGYIASQSGVILKSTNSGDSWFSLQHPYPFAQEFTCLSFLDISTGFVVGYGETLGSPIAKTTDGGISWIRYLNPTQTPLYSVKMANLDTGLIGNSYGFRRTINGGTNWNITYTSGSFYTDIEFPTSEIAYAAGGNIVKSTDGGINWNVQYSLANVQFGGVCFVNENTGYAVGQNGTIMKTTSGGVVNIKMVSNFIPDKYILYQNYPNPFNPETKIKFEINKSSFVQIKVYDILGKEISVLVNEKLNTGVFETKFDGSDLPGGVYYYSIKAGEFEQVRKMILLK